MKIITSTFSLQTRGNGDIQDISPEVEEKLSETGCAEGFVNIFISGSTGGITTIEYEPGLQKDFPDMLERLVPESINYEHHKTWGDTNGSGHCRASLIGPSVTLPFTGGSCILGTWQQIVFIELDSHARNRRIHVTLIGE